MSLNTENLSPADIAAVTGNGNNGGFGWGGDASWIIILFLFAMFSGNWGNNGNVGGGGGMTPYYFNNTDNNIQRGFDTAALTGQLSGIQTSLTNGFADAEVAGCNRAMAAMQTAYTNQIADMNQNFANQQATAAQLNGISSQLASCCCDNRLATTQLQNVIQTEACADRSAISEALRDVLEANNASTQRILDTMCQDKIDAKNERIAELQNQLTMAQLAASQNAQTAAIVANNEAQTVALERYLAPSPVPAYLVPQNSCCNNNYGCGCGMA